MKTAADVKRFINAWHPRLNTKEGRDKFCKELEIQFPEAVPLVAIEIDPKNNNICVVYPRVPYDSEIKVEKIKKMRTTLEGIKTCTDCEYFRDVSDTPNMQGILAVCRLDLTVFCNLGSIAKDCPIKNNSKILELLKEKKDE